MHLILILALAGVLLFGAALGALPPPLPPMQLPPRRPLLAKLPLRLPRLPRKPRRSSSNDRATCAGRLRNARIASQGACVKLAKTAALSTARQAIDSGGGAQTPPLLVDTV